MPLHLLGKKSWNVYNTANIARVKADEEAAAAREAADEQRMQELDAERRAAILRGRTPPPLPTELPEEEKGRRRNRDDRTHDRKRRKLAGEDDTDMDIRLAASATAVNDDIEDKRIMQLRNPKIDAPLTDHAGNIDLFPVDMKEAIKREKNAEVEQEKRKRERAFEDQYTMRFSNAAGKDGLNKPWYVAKQDAPEHTTGEEGLAMQFPDLENKNVWGNEDPRRKEREQARISSKDPFAFMQQAQKQLKQSKEDKKRWAAERDRELRELRLTQERDDRREHHHRRRKRDDNESEIVHSSERHRDGSKARSSRHKLRDRSRSRSRSRSRDRDKHGRRSGHERKHRDSQRSRDRDHEHHRKHSSTRHDRDGRDEKGDSPSAGVRRR